MKLEKILAYLNDELPEQEIEEVFNWIDKSPENKRKFINLKIAWSMVVENYNATMPSADKIIRIAKAKEKQKETTRIFWGAAIAMVASLLLLFGLRNSSKSTQIYDPFQNSPGAVLITMPNGIKREAINRDTILENGQIVAIYNPDSIAYLNNPDIPFELKIDVPYGKTFKVNLPDGSKVQLNAGSHFQYSQNNSSSKRLANLDGEGFFNVTKYKQQSFIVVTDKIKVEVLGTHFNVKSYSEDQIHQVILTEGRVKCNSLTNPMIATILEPGEKLTFNSKDKKLHKEFLQNYNDLAWQEDKIRMDKMSSEAIFDQLQKYYGIEIQNNYAYLNTVSFSGSLDLSNHTVIEILDILILDTEFEYTLNNKTITINNPNN